MKALYLENMRTASAITSPDEASGTVLENLYTRQLASYAEFVAPGSSLTINITFPQNVEFTGVGMAGHNFGEGSSITVTGVGSGPIDTFTGVAEVPRTVATSVQIVISDPTMSPGDDRQIGRLEIGLVHTFPAINDTIKFSRRSTSTFALSASRQAYGYRGVVYSEVSVQIPVVEFDEVTPIREFYDYVDRFVPFFLHFDEEELDVKDMYCILENMEEIPFQMNDAHFFTSAFTFSEVY